MFDFLKNSWAAAIESASSTVQSATAEWRAAVADLKQKASEFTQVYAQLLLKKNAAKTPADKARVDALLSKGDWVRKTVNAVTRAIDMGAQVLPKNLLGAMSDNRNLGVLPLVPIAVIVGGVSVMTAWLADARVELRRLDLIEQGHDPDPGGFEWSPWMWIPVTGLGMVVVWQMMSRRK